MKIEERNFEVSTPTPDGEAVADCMQIRIPMEWDKELAVCDKTSLDFFWLKDKSLAEQTIPLNPRPSPMRSSTRSKPAWRVFARLQPPYLVNVASELVQAKRV